VTIAVVHQGTDEQARTLLDGLGLGGVARVSDPDRALYRAFHLGRGGLREILAPAVLRRSAEAFARGHRQGEAVGDRRQMPGVFVVHGGDVVEEFRHRTIADRPDYLAMARRRGRGVAGDSG
jgi:hypothetical protein